MKRILISFALFSILFLSFIVLTDGKKDEGNSNIPGEENLLDSSLILAKKNYQEYCASCHYDNLSWFTARKWKYGQGLWDVRESILTGYPELGMPSYRQTFSDEEVLALADYIHKTLDLGYVERENSLGDKNYYVTEKLNIRPDTVIRGLNVPWGMAFLPDGDMLVNEREGKMLRYRDGKLVAEIKNLPEIKSIGQGGLMDIRLHPDYRNNGWIYFAYVAPSEDDKNVWGTRIMRARLKGNELTDKQLLFKVLPYAKTGHHFGCKITFDGKGHVFFGDGERGTSENSQNLSNDCGKIHRLNEDGTIPTDNPFYNTPGANKSIWSYGHRNPQGLVISPFTGQLWETEHGPKGGDELNLIEPGKNYGWPEITFGINYNGTIITKDTAKAGMEQPVTYYIPSIAPCGTTFVTGERYKGWEGNILIGSLRFRNLERVELTGNKVSHKETILYNIGRMRNVEMGPDGYIYVGVEEPGMIIRLVPL
jgi:glucose/arabinose dehydrogenase